MWRNTGKACIRLAVLQLAALLTACVTAAPPNEQVAAARAMVSQAQPVALRDGALELNNAQVKLARAEAAMQRGDYLDARIFAEQAEVDAKYAWTLAENARMQLALAELDHGLRALRDELERTPR